MDTISSTDASRSEKTVRVRLLGIAGSLRRASLNRRLLRAAVRDLPAGVELEIWRGLPELPPYNQDEDGEPAQPTVASLRRAIQAADGVLVASPEYNRSIPGVLKNALDWASRPWGRHALKGKPVAVIGASPGSHGAARGQAETRRVLDAIRAEVVEVELAVGNAPDAFVSGEDRLADGALQARLGEVVRRLAKVAGSVPAAEETR